MFFLPCLGIWSVVGWGGLPMEWVVTAAKQQLQTHSMTIYRLLSIR